MGSHRDRPRAVAAGRSGRACLPAGCLAPNCWIVLCNSAAARFWCGAADRCRGLRTCFTRDALHEAGPGFPAPDNVADWGMLAVLVSASLSVVLLLAGICYLYAQAITAEGSAKWDRRPGERDAIGEIIRGQS
jgi:hypothetical protein